MRLVIPAGASPADVAFQGKTWQQIADENGADGIQNLGDQWCIDNAQRDRMLADLAAATLALGQQINLLRGDVDVTDLEDPGV